MATVEVIDPDDIDFVSEAISAGPGTEKFDVVRKIASLATLLGQDVVSAEAAARAADGAVFAKAVECQVGDGRISEEAGAEAIVDRKTSAFASAARSMIAECVESGCEAIGVAIGSAFGSPTIGYAVGSAVGHFLNQPVGELVQRGARRVVEYASHAWQGIKRAVSGVFNSVVNWLFA